MASNYVHTLKITDEGMQDLCALFDKVTEDLHNGLFGRFKLSYTVNPEDGLTNFSIDRTVHKKE